MVSGLKKSGIVSLIFLGLLQSNPTFSAGADGPDIQIQCPCEVAGSPNGTSTVTIGAINKGSLDKELIVDLYVHTAPHFNEGFYLAEGVTLDAISAGSTLVPKAYTFENIGPSSGTYYITAQLFSKDGENISTDDQIRMVEQVDLSSEYTVQGIDLLADADGDGVGDFNESLEGTDANSASSLPGKSTIDLLIVYDDSLESTYGSKEAGLARIDHVIKVSNTALVDSNVNVEFRAVHKEIINADKSLEAKLDAAGQDAEEYAGLSALRAEFGADLVTIVTTREDSICGLANAGGSNLEGHMDGAAYINTNSLVFDGCDDMTVLHEIGHNMGLGHSAKQGDTGTFVWSRGYGQVDNFHTVMAYDSAFTSSEASEGPKLISVLSNPEISVCNGAPCGISIDQNQPSFAAKSLDIVRFQVSRYQPTVVVSVVDTDTDGIPDESDMDDDNDGLPDAYEVIYGLDPLVNDSSQDADNDGLTNLEEYNQGSHPNNALSPGETAALDTDQDGTPDESDTDDDNDGIPDTNEVAYGFDPLVNDSGLDADSDGLTNLEEHTQSTDPNNALSPYPSDVAESAQRDFNGDGTPDILLRRTSGSWYLYTLQGASISAAGSVSITGNTDWQPMSFADFNGDGRADILIRHKTLGIWWLYTMDGTSILNSAGVAVTRDLAWTPLSFADTDNDGNADILMRHTDGRWWRYGLSGATVLADGAIGATRDVNFEPVSFDDFNGDGNADILVRHKGNGAWWLYSLNGGSVVGSGSVSANRSLSWTPRFFADFNGDNKADILVRNKDLNTWWLYMMDGSTVGASGKIRASNNEAWHPLATEDFDADGKADLLLRNESGSWWMYTLDGNSILTQSRVGLIGSNDWRAVSFEDFNADSRADVLIRNIKTGAWWLYALDGQTVLSSGSGKVSATPDLNWQLQP